MGIMSANLYTYVNTWHQEYASTSEKGWKRMKMRIVLDDGAYEPERAHDTDAGLDLKTPVDFTINARSYETIDTGVHVELPPGTVGLLKSKSGLNVKKHVVSEGVIDEGYTGSIKVKMYNHGFFNVAFKAGDKITQLVIVPCERPRLEVVKRLTETERGNNGFGSTGR